MIYFDNASSTVPTKECLDIFYKTSLEAFSNTNSIHSLGMKNFNDLIKVKEDILASLNLNKDYEVIFTSGATESNNLAIRGYALKNRNRGNKLITTKIEHESVLNVFKELENEGFKVTYLDVNSEGKIDLENFKKVIDKETILVSIMPINNEVGNILNVKEIQSVIKDYPKCVLHCDCAQTLGKLDFDYKLTDMATISGHKIYGIKGVGALIKKKKIMLKPIVEGGGQENGLRSGTIDYPAIKSFQYSIKNVLKEYRENLKNIEDLQGFLINERENIDGIKLNLFGKSSPFIVNFSFEKKKASVIVEALSNRQIYVSSLSACNSKKHEPSHVLLAFGRTSDEASNAIRISLCTKNTMEEGKEFIKNLKEIMQEIKDRWNITL